MAIAEATYSKLLRSDMFHKERWARGSGNASQELVFGSFSPNAGDSTKTIYLTPGNIQSVLNSVQDNERVVFAPGVYPNITPELTGSFVKTADGKKIEFPGHVDKVGKKPIPYLPFIVPMLYIIGAVGILTHL